jgi:tripartite-type tricarboxylate transporter receptor subunit TctC
MVYCLPRKVLLSLFLLILGANVQAQDYPVKPVKIMVGASPGGGTDILARMLADKFSQSLKQTFIVENKPGAANTLAADVTAKAAPDGYTLLLATNTAQAIAPHMMKLGYDPLKDLQPIGLVVTVPQVLVVGTNEPYQDLKSLLAAMVTAPASFNFGSSGIGSTQHVAGEALNLAANVHAKHVPYKGSSQAHIDLIAGQIQFMIDTTSSSMPQIKAGKLRPLAITSPNRSPQLPDVPTMTELGYPSVSVTTWYGLYTTGGTPKTVVTKLHTELLQTLNTTDVQERLLALGGQSILLTSEQFAEMNRADFNRYGEIVRTANIKEE